MQRIVLRVVGNGDQKKLTKNPRHFPMQNSQATTKKYPQNVSGEETNRSKGGQLKGGHLKAQNSHLTLQCLLLFLRQFHRESP